jgi:hypothetical protein
LTELDVVNAEDCLVIAVEMLIGIKQYDPTLLMPHNTTALAMLEHA